MSNILNLIYIKFMAFYGKITYKKYVKMSKNASKNVEKLLLKRIRKNENTEFGIKHNYKDIKSYEDYKRIMPLTGYNDYKEYLDNNEILVKYHQGEKRVTPGQTCVI